MNEVVNAFVSRIQVLPQAIYTCDANGFIKFYNNAAVQLWGREPIAGKDLWCGAWKILDIEGTALPLQQFAMVKTIKNGKPQYAEVIILVRPDGSYRYINPNTYPLFNVHGQITGAVNMLVDITDHYLKENKQYTQAAYPYTTLPQIFKADENNLSKAV